MLRTRTDLNKVNPQESTREEETPNFIEDNVEDVIPFPKGGAHPVIESAPQPIPARVYYEDTDAEGVMYHAAYVRFAERGRTEWLREALAHDGKMWQGEQGPFFVVRRMTVDYYAPAYLDDPLLVQTDLTHLGGASMQMTQKIVRDGQTLCRLHFVLVSVTPDAKPVRLPQEWRDKIKPFLIKDADDI